MDVYSSFGEKGRVELYWIAPLNFFIILEISRSQSSGCLLIERKSSANNKFKNNCQL